MVKIFYIFVLMAFALIYFGMKFMLKTYAGWIALEKKYQTLKKPSQLNGGNLNINKSSLGGGIWLKNIISYYSTDAGLLLTQLRILRGSKFNILIPWKDIIACKEIKMNDQKFVQIIIGDPKQGQIDIEEKDFQKIRGRVTHASYERTLDL